MALNTTLGRLEFENGKLVKVGWVRYQYMKGDALIRLIGELGDRLATQNLLLEELEWSGEQQTCPVCRQLKKPSPEFSRDAVGHKPDCRLGKALGRFDKPGAIDRLMGG